MHTKVNNPNTQLKTLPPSSHVNQEEIFCLIFLFKHFFTFNLFHKNKKKNIIRETFHCPLIRNSCDGGRNRPIKICEGPT